MKIQHHSQAGATKAHKKLQTLMIFQHLQIRIVPARTIGIWRK
jgi:hypothetical protein